MAITSFQTNLLLSDAANVKEEERIANEPQVGEEERFVHDPKEHESNELTLSKQLNSIQPGLLPSKSPYPKL